MPGQLHTDLKKQRSARLREIFARSAESYHRKFLGQELAVLWEATSEKAENGWRIEGLTDNYIRVSAIAPEPRWNRLDRVRLLEISGEGVRGEIL
jgi:threonylcarbamoyladenosine tRNA methylthiotransferase MtaB